MGRVALDLAAQPGDPQIDGAVERLGLAVRGSQPDEAPTIRWR
jgi:hypothetical protein